MANGKFDAVIPPILISAAMLGIALPLADGLRRLRKTEKPAGIDVRYARIAGAVPQESILGYTSDLSDRGPGLRLFLQAQYAMAPHVLLEGSGRRFTLANMKDPAASPTMRENQSLPPRGEHPAGIISPPEMGAR